MESHKFDKSFISNWDAFVQLAADFDYTLKETGGIMLTHEINCSRTDFTSLVQLAGKTV